MPMTPFSLFCALAAHRNGVLPQITRADLAATGAGGRTLLMEAALAGNTEAVNRLCTLGADVHAVDAEGNTALHHAAAEGGHTAAALLAAGADPFVRNENGETPLVYALEGDTVFSLMPLLQAYRESGVRIDEDDAEPLYNEAVGDSVTALGMKRLRAEELAVLLSLGAPVGICDEAGDTPLLIAARRGWALEVNALLEAGANPNDCTPYPSRETALHLAVRAHNARCVKALLDYGADPDARDADGRTPLFIAFSQGQFGIAVVLAEGGAGLTARFTDAQIDVLYRTDIMCDLFPCITRDLMARIKDALLGFRRVHTPYYRNRNELPADYLLIAILYMQPALARLLVRRCPALLPPELAEPFYRFLSIFPLED